MIEQKDVVESPVEIEQYLHEHIPISAAMGVSVRSASPEAVQLGAPLDLNINHRSTVFGGSAAAVGILAGWTLLHVRLGHHREARARSRIVIQSSHVRYDAPIEADFTAKALPPEGHAWDRFMRTLERRGRARIEIGITLEVEGKCVGGLTGTYVVLPED